MTRCGHNTKAMTRCPVGDVGIVVSAPMVAGWWWHTKRKFGQP